jgi:hypothetical protein
VEIRAEGGQNQPWEPTRRGRVQAIDVVAYDVNWTLETPQTRASVAPAGVSRHLWRSVKTAALRYNGVDFRRARARPA